jgi:alkanesulfonate monooxygenase SsuD/methylene tetrahydromethanopterin reductase-like flavin-dependent oxidoreductase (luciferase family)
MSIRFCAYQYQHLPFPELEERWHRAEELGFDVLWNVDTVVEPDRPRSTMFDGPSTLAVMAVTTHWIRIGTLVTSLYFRSPVTAAKAAVTVDHLSEGRLEIALGVGDPSAGEGAAGVTWGAGERVRRFGEFVELLERLLTNEVTSFDGEFYRCTEAETIPLPIQRPRPPITIAAHGPKMLRIAAERADGWSSWGGYDVETEEQMFAVTRDRSHRFDDLCVDAGRDPRSI